jgi:hypothetical protein
MLDDPNPMIAYYAYTAIERIRGQGRSTIGARGFYGDARSFSGQQRVMTDADCVPTSHSRMLVNDMKQWWATEGKRQFDYVLPKK